MLYVGGDSCNVGPKVQNGVDLVLFSVYLSRARSQHKYCLTILHKLYDEYIKDHNFSY